MAEEKKIEDYFKYVAHSIKGTDYRLARRIFDCIASRIFSGVDVIGIEKLAEQRKKDEREGIRTVNVYVERHMSEFDWQETQRALAHVGMLSAVQAGSNLFIGPLDSVLRHFGAFKVFREETRLFSHHWFVHSACRFMDGLWRNRVCKAVFSALRVPRKKPVTIDQQLMRNIYIAYMKHLLHNEGRDVLVFPEYSKDDGKNIKYGRSYNGRLLDFTPVVFKLLRDINKTTDRRIQIVPVNVSYERVVEDQMFRTLKHMNAQSSLKGLTYLADYCFNYMHWLFQRKKGRVVIKFGEPVAMRKKIDFKIRLHDELRKKVGALQTIFPSQIVGYACGDDAEVSEPDLVKRVEKTLEELRNIKADLTCVKGLSARDIIGVAYGQFNQNCTRRIIVRNRTSGMYVVKRPDVLVQYRNHILHLFEKWYDRKQLVKTVKSFGESRETDIF